jgi:hypothetical protein
VTLTKKSSTIPLNKCPICKSKTPKRSLNPSAEASKLCLIYEEIVREYSEINGGNDDWIHEAGIRGNDAYYTGGGVPLDNLSQLYPYPEKPSTSTRSGLTNISETECDSQSSDLFPDLEDGNDENTTQLIEEEKSKIYDQTAKPIPEIDSKLSSLPSSPLIYSEETQLTCDRLIINTQELEKLAAMNESIDKELAELEKRLAGKGDFVEEVKDSEIAALQGGGGDIKENKDIQKQKLAKYSPSFKVKVKVNSSKSKTREIKSEAQAKEIQIRKRKLSPESDEVFSPKALKKLSVDHKPDMVSVDHKPNMVSVHKLELQSEMISGLTTTGIKDENALIQLTKFSDKFDYPILPDFHSEEAQVTHLLVPTTGPSFILKKRTMKYFEALLLKKEIISFDWIEACLKAEKLLSSTAFKIKGDEVGFKQGKGGSKRVEDVNYSKIFSSYKFHLYGDFSQPPRDQLEHLIKSSKAIIFDNVQELSRGSIVLADPSSQFTFEKDAEIIKKYPIVSPAWFLDSISCGKALDFHGYLIL